MSEVVKGNFSRDGFDIGDKRAMALHDWMINLGRPATTEEMKAEVSRLRSIMPAPEDKKEQAPIQISPERIAPVGYINDKMEHALVSIYGAALLNPSLSQKSVQVAISIKGATELRDRLDEFLASHIG